MTLKRPKDKGTSEETAVVRAWAEELGDGFAHRMPAGANYDVHIDGAARNGTPPIEVLATRPDRGQRLYTLREQDFMDLVRGKTGTLRRHVHIEVKRYARFALHTIFEAKFGGRR